MPQIDNPVFFMFAFLSAFVFIATISAIFFGWIASLVWGFIDRESKPNIIMQKIPRIIFGRVIRGYGGWVVMTGLFERAGRNSFNSSYCEFVERYCVFNSKESAISCANSRNRSVFDIVFGLFYACLCIFVMGAILQWLLYPFIFLLVFACVMALSRFTNDLRKSFNIHKDDKSVHLSKK